MSDFRGQPRLVLCPKGVGFLKLFNYQTSISEKLKFQTLVSNFKTIDLNDSNCLHNPFFFLLGRMDVRH